MVKQYNAKPIEFKDKIRNKIKKSYENFENYYYKKNQ